MSNSNFLYLGDKNYFKYAVASIYSLLKNNRHLNEIVIYYIDDNLMQDEKKHLEEIIRDFGRKIVWISAEPLAKFLKEHNIPQYKGTYAPYYRWFVYDYLPDDERLIYMDSDTIVTNQIDKIISFDMHGKPLAMCRDAIYDFYVDYLNLEDKPYFNTGVIVFDVYKCKEINIKQLFIDTLLQCKRTILFSEQDIASIAFNDYTAILNANMNVYANYMGFSVKNFYKALSINLSTFYTEEEVEFAKLNPIIKHGSAFFGSRPWHNNTIHPYADEFNENFYKAGYTDKDKSDFKLPFVKKFIYTLPEGIKTRLYALLCKVNIKYRLLAQTRRR